MSGRDDLIAKLPNWLTYARLALIPVFVALLNEPSKFMQFLAIVVFIIAALTDYVDGYVARRYGAVSDFGKLLDPLADKILVMAALVMLVSLRSDVLGEPWIPGWMVVLVLAREIWVTGLRAVAATNGHVISASGAGKIKSGFQMVAIVLLLCHDAKLPFLSPQFNCQFVGANLLLISIILSYWGAYDYTKEALWGSRSGTLTPEEPVSNGKSSESFGDCLKN